LFAKFDYNQRNKTQQKDRWRLAPRAIRHKSSRVVVRFSTFSRLWEEKFSGSGSRPRARR